MKKYIYAIQAVVTMILSGAFMFVGFVVLATPQDNIFVVISGLVTTGLGAYLGYLLTKD